jgi:hypothetical protein
MPVPVLMPRWMTSEPVLAGKLLRLLVPVSLKWPMRLTWPMAKVTTSQPEADAISHQLRMLARPEPLVLLPPLVALPPSTLVRVDPRTPVRLDPSTLVRVDPRTPVRLDPSTLVRVDPRTLVRLDPSTLDPPPRRTLAPLVPPPPSMLVPLLPLVVPSALVAAVQQRIMIPPKRLARA